MFNMIGSFLQNFFLDSLEMLREATLISADGGGAF